MKQTSISQFFGSNTTKKNANEASDKAKNDSGNLIKSDTKQQLIKQSSDSAIEAVENIDEVKAISKNRKRKTFLASDSDSNDFDVEKPKEKLSKRLSDEKSPEKRNNCDKTDDLNTKEMETVAVVNNKAPSEYDPMINPYHIINDACWKPNDKIPYLALAKTFEVIESTTKRLEITRTLSNFMRSVIYLSPNDLLPCVYLCLNKVAPDYEGAELGVGETVVKNALIQATDVDKKTIDLRMKKEGDLGLIAYNLPSSQRYLVQPAKLTVPSVFQKLKIISETSGKSSSTNKTDIIKNLLIASSKCERKYIVRSLLGKLRIRLAEQTVLAALGQAITMTPPNESQLSKSQNFDSLKPIIDKNTAIIKTAFCQCPNYDLLIESIFKYGISNLSDHCSIFPGVPIKPMLAHPSKGVSEVFQRFDKSDFTCEYKYDGERAQIHVSTDVNGKLRIQIFSRNQENNTSKYPDIVKLINEILENSDIKSCIIDSEAVAWDRETKSILPFQKLSTRKRKDVNESDIKIQVCIHAFDLIYFNGQSLVESSFRERRKILRENFTEKHGYFVLATSLDSCNTDEISEFLEQSIKDKCEGLMIKTLDEDATYEISKRSHNWLKLKKDYLDKMGDTVDLVVIGASYGTGKRANKYGTFLLACYDSESELFQTICRLGTGFTDEDLDNFYTELKETVTRKPTSSFDYDKSQKPDCWFEPKHVWEIKAADLSISPDHRAAIGLVDKDKGISLRFPRFIRVREDKKVENATTARQIAEMYRNQDSMKTAESTVNPYEDDEFY